MSGSAQADAKGAGSKEVQERRRKGISQVTLVYLIVLAFIPLSRLISPAFPSTDQVENILVLGSFLAIVAFGQGLVILTGGIDLSVAAIITASAVFMSAITGAMGNSALVGVLLTLGVGILIGLFNGIGVAYLKIPPFIMTLATGVMATSILLGQTNGSPSGASPPVLRELFGTGRIFGIPITIFFFAALVFVGWLIQSRTTYGQRLYAVGNGEIVARISGLPVKQLITSVYVVSGLCCAIAGIMLLGFTAGANLSIGNDYLLPSIAAVVVGGTAIRGGTGRHLGTVAGVLLLTTVSTDISAMQLSEGWKQIVYGAIVLAALVLSRESPEGGSRSNIFARLRTRKREEDVDGGHGDVSEGAAGPGQSDASHNEHRRSISQ